jgi:hypothetical protein
MSNALRNIAVTVCLVLVLTGFLPASAFADNCDTALYICLTDATVGAALCFDQADRDYRMCQYFCLMAADYQGCMDAECAPLLNEDLVTCSFGSGAFVYECYDLYAQCRNGS